MIDEEPEEWEPEGYASTELPVVAEATGVENAMPRPAEDRPVWIARTPLGVKLAFFHASRALPPIQLTIPHEQWGQMVRLLGETGPRVRGFEAFVGFTPESLALHCIEDVESIEM